LNRRARVIADEQGAVTKTCRIFGQEMRRWAEDQDVHHLDLAQVARALDERTEKTAWRARAPSDVDTLT
jgi:glutamate/tyrosine decarboxylase-like PLP-dependent enzyme